MRDKSLFTCAGKIAVNRPDDPQFHGRRASDCGVSPSQLSKFDIPLSLRCGRRTAIMAACVFAPIFKVWGAGGSGHGVNNSTSECGMGAAVLTRPAMAIHREQSRTSAWQTGIWFIVQRARAANNIPATRRT